MDACLQEKLVVGNNWLLRVAVSVVSVGVGGVVVDVVVVGGGGVVVESTD